MYSEEGGPTDISVIIPVYRGQKYCQRILEMMERNCLFENLYEKCSVEVIFVNDYPEERIVIEQAPYHFTVKVAEQDKNRGIHASRVDGILKSQSEYIIMLDQDDLVKDRWLYSQWNRIHSENMDFCVCNGWKDRYRVLWEKDIFINRVNNLDYYLNEANAILSPGQVILRKRCIPWEWMENILASNGSDDFLLWIMVLKQGYKFILNDECIYYHTPDRSADSVTEEIMLKSAEEAAFVLHRLNFINQEELGYIQNQIKVRRDGAEIKSYVKFREMFFILYNWMLLKEKGVRMGEYFEKKGFLNIAIYGMGYLGECFYNELSSSLVNVRYAMDRSAKDFEEKLLIFRMDDAVEKVDAVVITIVEGRRETVDKLKEKLGCPILTLSEVLADLNGGLLIM